MSSQHTEQVARHNPPAALLPVPNASDRGRRDSPTTLDESDDRRRPQLRNEILKLSIVMPAYNEERTIASAIDAVLSTEYPCPVELIIVDDGSTDRTFDLASGVADRRVRVVRHPLNLGKGAAVLSGAATAVGN